MDDSREALVTINLTAAGLTETEFRRLGFKQVPGISQAFIFDSIVLWQPVDETHGDASLAEAVCSLSYWVARVIGRNSLNDIRLRGAVACGECLVSVDDTFILLGKPVGEAYSWEQAQDWMGAMLAPSAVDAIIAFVGDTFLTNPDPGYLVEYGVPLKWAPAHLPRPVAIDWTFPVTLTQCYKVPEVLQTDRERADVQRKVENTILFCKTTASHARR